MRTACTSLLAASYPAHDYVLKLKSVGREFSLLVCTRHDDVSAGNARQGNIGMDQLHMPQAQLQRECCRMVRGVVAVVAWARCCGLADGARHTCQTGLRSAAIGHRAATTRAWHEWFIPTGESSTPAHWTKRYGLTGSVSRKGHCRDNAVTS